jgi:hypothetical protein
VTVDAAWFTSVPDARVDVLPGQQHVAKDTAPEMFAQVVASFLANAEDPSDG